MKHPCGGLEALSSVTNTCGRGWVWPVDDLGPCGLLSRTTKTGAFQTIVHKRNQKAQIRASIRVKLSAIHSRLFSMTRATAWYSIRDSRQNNGHCHPSNAYYVPMCVSATLCEFKSGRCGVHEQGTVHPVCLQCVIYTYAGQKKMKALASNWPDEDNTF